MHSRLTLAAAVVALTPLAGSLHAAVLVEYKMTASGDPLNGALFLGPTTSAANLTATTLVNQSGGSAAGSFIFKGNTDRASAWSTTNNSTGTGYSGAYVSNNYFTFSITPAEGYKFDLESITFEVASGNNNATHNRAFYLVTATSPAAFSISSTVLATDSTPGGGGTIPLQSGTGGVDTVPKSYNADLSSFSGITTTQTFRFYLRTDTISQSLVFDNIVVNGTLSAIPEPSSFALALGVAALGFAAGRKRRR
jgi:hypothetical protein